MAVFTIPTASTQEPALPELEIQSNLENVDWVGLTTVYVAAFGAPSTVGRIQNIFRHANVWRIAHIEDEIVGAVYGWWDGELDATILGLVVHPNWQHHGIGHQLMESLLSQFPPGTAILLTAEAKNTDFYRSLGFRPLKTAMGLGFPADQFER